MLLKSERWRIQLRLSNSTLAFWMTEGRGARASGNRRHRQRVSGVAGPDAGRAEGVRGQNLDDLTFARRQSQTASRLERCKIVAFAAPDLLRKWPNSIFGECFN